MNWHDLLTCVRFCAIWIVTGGELTSLQCSADMCGILSDRIVTGGELTSLQYPFDMCEILCDLRVTRGN